MTAPVKDNQMIQPAIVVVDNIQTTAGPVIAPVVAPVVAPVGVAAGPVIAPVIAPAVAPAATMLKTNEGLSSSSSQATQLPSNSLPPTDAINKP